MMLLSMRAEDEHEQIMEIVKQRHTCLQIMERTRIVMNVNQGAQSNQTHLAFHLTLGCLHRLNTCFLTFV